MGGRLIGIIGDLDGRLLRLLGVIGFKIINYLNWVILKFELLKMRIGSF